MDAKPRQWTAETERLELMPLPPEQLRQWAEDLPALERALCCCCRAELMEGHLLEVVKGQLAIVEKEPDRYRWHSFWLMLRKADRVVVGSADFKGPPNAAGEAEIGYGLGKTFEHNGYMTEAVRAMLDWAMAQPGVECVIAETEKDNLASQRVLLRCGFQEFRRGETLWWRYGGMRGPERGPKRDRAME